MDVGCRHESHDVTCLSNVTESESRPPYLHGEKVENLLETLTAVGWRFDAGYRAASYVVRSNVTQSESGREWPAHSRAPRWLPAGCADGARFPSSRGAEQSAAQRSLSTELHSTDAGAVRRAGFLWPMLTAAAPASRRPEEPRNPPPAARRSRAIELRSTDARTLGCCSAALLLAQHTVNVEELVRTSHQKST